MNPEDKVLEVLKENSLTNKDIARVTNLRIIDIRKLTLNRIEKIRQYNREYNKKRYREDIGYKLRVLVHCRLKAVVKGKFKSKTIPKLCGTSIDKLKRHIESKFLPGMSWDNHGDWHIDHIKPCASFNLTDEAQLLECFNYKNLQPLWAEDNLRKNKY